MPLKAVLADWDDTLAKGSGDIWLDANRIAFAKYTKRPLEPDTLRTHGSDICALLQICGVDEAFAEVIEQERNEIYNKLLAEQSEWKKGAPEFLGSVRERNLKTCVVTRARLSNLLAQSERLPFLPLVDATVTKEDVEKEGLYKPDPASVHIGARKLNVLTTECIVLGDDHVDMQMAINAGVPGILVPGPHTKPEAFNIATHTVDELEKVLRLLVDQGYIQ